MSTMTTQLEIDPSTLVLGAKLSALINVVLRPLDLDGEQLLQGINGAISSGLLAKDQRPKQSEDERMARADDAERKARLYSSACHWLENNPPSVYSKEDRSTFKSLPELMDAMAIPRVERTPRYTAILRTVLTSGQTDWGLVLKLDGMTFYGARPRLLQYAAAA
jgi:hypothetical protein